MKRKLICFIVMSLMAVNTVMVQAATTDSTDTTNTNVAATATNTNTITVSLDNIKEIMTENNLNMKVADNTLKTVEETFKEKKDIADDYDIDELKTSYGTANEAYNNYTGTDSTEKDKLKAASDAAKTNYQTAEKAKDDEDTARKAYKKAKISYDQSVVGYIHTAQNDYVSYLAAVSKRVLEENAVKIKERTAETYKLQYESGFLAKNDYTKALRDITTENSALSKLKDDEELAKTNLCIELGISDQEKVAFSTDIKNDLDKVSQIKYDDDLNKMLENNFNVQSKNIDLDQAKDDKDDYDDTSDDKGIDDDTVEHEDNIYDYKINNAKISLTQAANNAKSEFKSQYNTLMNSYNTMKNNYDSLNQSKTDYNIAQAKYDYGFASKNEVEDAKIGSKGLDQSNSDYENAKNSFYQNYLRYLQMKEGY